MEKKLITSNKRAFIRYEIAEKIEAGIELKGTEVKSLRAHHADLADSYARLDDGEVFLCELYIAPYEKGSYMNVDSRRMRKLLLHRREINKMSGKLTQRGYTLIPLNLYFNSAGKVKVELALARGRQLHDQREKLKGKEVNRQIQQELGRRR